MAYNAAAYRMHGEFARLNLIGGEHGLGHGDQGDSVLGAVRGVVVDQSVVTAGQTMSRSMPALV